MGEGKDCDDYICSNDKEEQQLKEIFSKGSRSSHQNQLRQPGVTYGPLNAVELGRSTWPLLHKFTLGYPEKPTEDIQRKALTFIQSFAQVYPCKICAKDFQTNIDQVPPPLDSRKELALWMCEQHNVVNRKLGKSEFKCNMRRLELIHGSSHRKWENIV